MELDKFAEWATVRGMALEDYIPFLVDAAKKVKENLAAYPESSVEIDPDIAEYLEIENWGQEVTPEEMDAYMGSTLDANLHESEGED
ncbi:hypothetical protein [Desulfotalea psychrophila]|nr:hypothetical protein [Desulfotalea psychrophila]